MYHHQGGKLNAFTSFHNGSFKQLPTRPTRGDKRSDRGAYPKNRRYRGDLSQETEAPMIVRDSLARPRKLVRFQKTKSRTSLGCLQRFIALRVVVDMYVETFGGIARKYNISCTKRSDNSATWTFYTVLTFLRWDFHLQSQQKEVSLPNNRNYKSMLMWGYMHRA